MQLIPTNFSVSDYVCMFERGDVRVNRDYQRYGGQWPSPARSFFIETILLGYPIPKIYLYQIADVRTQRVVREIVDGQQRTETLAAFLRNEFRLTSNIETEELRGLFYDDLDAEHQQIFFSYPLPVDLFTAATDDEIRDIFRRINSYTSPLNAEEKRHAKFQGEFKWFANNLAKQVSGYFEVIGVFSQRSFIRMADLKIITEWVYAFERGLKTTKAKQLDDVYKDLNDAFPDADKYGQWIKTEVEFLAGIEEIHRSPLAKPHMFYALALAMMHLRHRIPSLLEIYDQAGFRRVHRDRLLNAVIFVLAILDDEDAVEPAEFIKAARAGTNVKEAREQRFRFLCEQLRPAFE
ncbi:MAG: DUF262 domain-containing protein [Methyloligella sp. ZOD6]